MPQDTVVYIVNLIIGAIVASLMSQHWRDESSGVPLRLWIIAAWTLTAADLLFVLRPAFPSGLVRMLPTLMVTVGHVVLLLATRRTVGRTVHWPLASLIVLLHALLLVGFLAAPAITSWRTVTNSVLWAGLSLAAAGTLWRGPQELRRHMTLPALVLAAQGVFHVVRTALATRAVVQPGSELGSLVQLLGDLEVSLFMVALFVSVLVSFLRQSNAQLRLAIDNVRQLSSMLPICSWCDKVRNDDGYWTRIEQYLMAHRVAVTHSICESCAAAHFAAGNAGSAGSAGSAGGGGLAGDAGA